MKVIIMRGIPGSGKSTEANKIMDGFSGSVGYCSADQYFVTDGIYKFDHTFIGEAHKSCMRRFLERVVHSRTDLVVVDNTNVHVWEYMPYVAIAEAESANIEIVEVVCDPVMAFRRQVHGCSERTHARMCEEFESVLPHHRGYVRVVHTDRG